MTKVRFTFFDIEGNPLQNMEFTLLLNRASFNEEDTGVILPESLVVTTDALGQAIVDLWPLKAAYKIRIAEEYEEVCGKLNWSFYVPQSNEIVDAQHLFLVPPPRNIPWDEEAISKINQAVIDSHNSAEAAENSADRAEVAATAAEAAIDTVAESARQAKLSEEAAALSATTAGGASTAAIQARDEAEGFRDQARTSELAASGSATTATEQAGLASQEKVKAQEYAEQAEFSKNDAEIARQGAVSASEASAASADESAASATQTGLDKQATAADRVAVTGLKTEVTGLKDETKGYRDEALAAVGTITGAFVDGGLVDLSGGAYPTKPDVSTIWKVQVGGTVTTVKEGTIVYAAGDQLVYTKTQDTWYKNVSQSAVQSVNGETGAVVLDKTDIGLDQVNNTSDVNKPISNAVQAALDVRVPTSSRTDTTAGRLVKVGDYGENGGGAIVKGASDDANAITVPGTYVFNGGGLNLPENTVYIKHFNHAVAGWSKQLAYGMQTNKVFVRTLNNNVWTDWGPAVEIVDSLTSADPAKALSARQGKILLEMLQANNATIIRYTFNVAAGQTTITGNSLEGIPLSYVPGVPFMVEKDGFPIWLVNDYTASNGSSITLTKASTVTSQIAITVFGAFSAADHYTKAQSDARYYQQSQTYTQAQVAALLDASVGQGFIEGLQLVWNTSTSIGIRAGSAFVPSVGKRVQYAGGNITPIGVVDVDTTVHIYLSETGTILQSLTAPERYYNAAHRLNGDARYRYIGSILVMTNAVGVQKFYHRLNDGYMQYMGGNSSAVDSGTRIATNATGVGSVSTAKAIPVTGHTMEGTFQNTGDATYNGAVQVSPGDITASVTLSVVVYLIPRCIFNASISVSSRSIAYYAGTGANLNVWCQGYWFDR